MSRLVILYGPAGSGKGTVSKALIHLDYNLIGAGEEIRQYIATKGLEDPLAKRMNDRIEQGLNVETQDLFQVVEQKIIALEGQKILGDGLVREVDQAQWLVNFSQESDIVAKFINLVAPFEVLKERLLKRYFIPNNPFPFPSYETALNECTNGELPIMRKDDNLDAIESRFRQYQEKSKPIQELVTSSSHVEYIEIEVDKTPDQVLHEVMLAI